MSQFGVTIIPQATWFFPLSATWTCTATGMYRLSSLGAGASGGCAMKTTNFGAASGGGGGGGINGGKGSDIDASVETGGGGSGFSNGTDDAQVPGKNAMGDAGHSDVTGFVRTGSYSQDAAYIGTSFSSIIAPFYNLTGGGGFTAGGTAGGPGAGGGGNAGTGGPLGGGAGGHEISSGNGAGGRGTLGGGGGGGVSRQYNAWGGVAGNGYATIERVG